MLHHPGGARGAAAKLRPARVKMLAEKVESLNRLGVEAEIRVFQGLLFETHNARAESRSVPAPMPRSAVGPDRERP